MIIELFQYSYYLIKYHHSLANGRFLLFIFNQQSSPIEVKGLRILNMFMEQIELFLETELNPSDECIEL